MAKKSTSITEPDPDATADSDVLPGETPDEYMDRLDAEESAWEGQGGAKGPSKHDANEHREPARRRAIKVSEDWDPHMGCM